MKKEQKKQEAILTPTDEQFNALNQAYEYFNQKLFDGILPSCLLNFSRKKGTHGFFAPERWRRVGEDKYSTHEISLTPTTFYRGLKEILSTLVHEQVHLWQWEFGNPSRNGYHNREWAAKMEEIGLMPSNTGKPGGKRTGQSMTHYIISEGRYEMAFDSMPKAFKLPLTSLEGDLMRSMLKGEPKTKVEGGAISTKTAKLRPKSRSKTKYSCPSCGVNVWGKDGLNLICEDCGEKLSINQ